MNFFSKSIKCHTFSESQARPDLNYDDDNDNDDDNNNDNDEEEDNEKLFFYPRPADSISHSDFRRSVTEIFGKYFKFKFLSFGT